jgi:hypothetical protein
MSVSTEVQRTLVKSPPELWSELSDPEALARHLAELGEVRITDIEPETKVEWEAEGASGVVRLKQSGWGTKVTLSVTRIAPAVEKKGEREPEPVAGGAEGEMEPLARAEPEPEPAQLAHVEAVVETELEAEPVAEPEPAVELKAAVQPAVVEQEPGVEPEAAEVEPEPVIELEPAVIEPEPVVEPVLAVEPEQEPQPGFFARLFRRRRIRWAELVEVEPEPIATVAPEPEYEFEALAAPEPVYVTQLTKAAADLAAELASVEAQMEQETTELLTGVLDRLGAAHHRPFSRG